MSGTVIKRSTIAGIAHLSGCSKAVVSTVLNGSRGNTIVGQALRERVERVAREVGYVPNHASQTLATGTSQTLGVYITPGPWVSVGAEYESAILRGIDLACREAGYDMLIFNLSGGHPVEDCIRKVNGQRVDGVIVVRARAGSAGLSQLLDACENVVAVDYNEPEPHRLRATSFDNAAAMRLAVEHLASLGHRRIGFIGNNAVIPVPDDLARRAGYARAMAGAGLITDARWMICDSPAPVADMEATAAANWGWEAVDRALALGDAMPTAFVAWSDSVAVAAMQRFAQRGVRVPEDVSLVGVDNAASCKMVWPMLTSIDHPLGEEGAAAARVLIETSLARRRGGERSDERPRQMFDPRLVVRGTTGPRREASSR